MRLFLHKLFHWEYWPFQVLYIPVYFQWLYFAFRSRSFFYFNACNPSLQNGGFFMESKQSIYDLIPSQYYPQTVLISENTSWENLEIKFKNSPLQFPLIAKPDIGLRGASVKKILNYIELKSYHEKANFDFLLQECIPYENEIGLFYVRYPHEKQGRITGIVAKEFLSIVGDGKSSIATLLAQNPRFAIQLPVLQKEYGSQLDAILPMGESQTLVPIGNHARGAKFLDYSDRITPELTQTFDGICRQIEGFYFGRLDIMFDNWIDLAKGQQFKIVELNGAASEPTHIYDPRHSLFFAWKELIRHQKMMFEISRLNHKKGHSFLSFKKGMEQYRLHQQHSLKIFAS